MSVPATNKRQAHRTQNSAYQTAKGHVSADTMAIRIYRMSHDNYLWRLSGEPAPASATLAKLVAKQHGQWPASI